MIGSRVVEETAVVHLGTVPGEQYGFECAACQLVTGLAYGSQEEAERDLAVHLAEDEEAERCGYLPADTFEEAWEKHAAAHPEVLASWGESNGQWPWGHPAVPFRVL